MDINRSGYYAWKNRKGKPNRYEVKRQILTEFLKDMHKHHKTYGYHNLAAHIREETGLEFSDNLAHKCCKLAGIKSKARKTYHPNKGEEHITYKNEIFTNWNAKRPLEIVVSDMTELSTKYFGKFEWTFFLDTYNNEIIASSLSRKKGDPKPYYDCLNTFIQKIEEKKEPVILHTDQGSIYSSKAFAKAHEHCTSIKRSMSRVATPTDNPIIEAINGWIKEELYIDFGLYRSQDIPKLINNYIHYFNNYRLSSKLQYKTPAQFRIEQGFD